MSAIAELGDKLANLTLKQAVELKEYLKETHKIEPAAGGGGGFAPAGPAVPVAPPVEATEFNVILTGFDPAKKIGVIKVVREITAQGLGEAKATVEGAPKSIKENVDKKTAEDLKAKIEKEGGKVEIKPA